MTKELSKRNSNKLEKKASFIAAAERLFLQKGFENTTIDDIVKESKLTKRTLYQYFTSKEDLFFAVILSCTFHMIDEFDIAIAKGKNALEKISLANAVYYKFYIDKPELFRLTNYKPDNMQSYKTSPHYTELEVIKSKRFKHYLDIVEVGKSDGSINSDLDAKMAVFFGFFSSIGLLNLISSTDEVFWISQGFDKNKFIQFSFNLLTNALI